MELKDWLNSVNHLKNNLVENPSDAKDYPPFIVNKCLSSHVDSLIHSNQMNMYHHLPKDMQYTYYLHALRVKKRFSPWLRKEKVSNLDAIKKYYGYSDQKALQVLKILNSRQIDIIKSKLETGGKDGKSNC